MKFMVVDDSAMTRRILINCLRTLGFTDTIEAADGQQALERCRPDVDLVITDWNMPGMTGIEFVRGLRSNADFAAIPVLLITSRNARGDVVEAADAGVNGYIVKPITPDVLRTNIEGVLTGWKHTGTEG